MIISTKKKTIEAFVKTFEAEKENSIESQRGDWQALLDNLKNIPETN
ncbi:MAG: hypothetical protein H0W61_04345 [Bacteroidetes bacterium]|nr:hypothetical protein [Bacteroidota bacterium]